MVLATQKVRLADQEASNVDANRHPTGKAMLTPPLAITSTANDAYRFDPSIHRALFRFFGRLLRRERQFPLSQVIEFLVPSFRHSGALPDFVGPTLNVP
jgi:hypothetical protein